jgi:hypothetical protein
MPSFKIKIGKRNIGVGKASDFWDDSLVLEK